MRSSRSIAVVALVLAALASSRAARAQATLYERFRSHNAAMTELQPTWMGPLIQSDPRLSQGAKFSVSNASAPGAQILIYGNNHGVALLSGHRFQFDFNPPSYFRNHSPALRDGFGNASTQVKYRIASGNADHGNFAITAVLSRAFGGGVQQNGMLTDFYCPKIVAGKAFGRFNLQSALNGVLPTGKIRLQGRVIEWNMTAQMHTSSHTYFDVENNSAWFKGGFVDGKMQNFLTPAGFYVFRRKGWEPTHAVVVFDAGMQIATSQFHCYNHNLITEMRLLF